MESNEFSSIINIVNLYAVAVDSHRYDLFEQVFTDDIICDFGGGAAFTDRQTLIDTFRNIHAVFQATQHMVSGHSILVDGNRAQCFSYVDGRFRRRISSGDGLFCSTGWYDDSLIRTPKGWRIRHRISRMVSHSGDIEVMQVMPGVDTNYDLASLSAEAGKGAVNFLANR